MDGKCLKKVVLFLSFSVALLWAGNKAFPSPSHFNFDVQSHSLKIQIDPPSHLLKAEDQIEILLKEEGTQILSFLLNSKLRITRIVNLQTQKPLSWKETPYSDRVKRLDLFLKKGDSPFKRRDSPQHPLSLSISYEGPIYDPVLKEKALQFVKGDQTTGLIGSEGVYLSSSSYWFPDRPNSMAIFQVEARIPDPFRIVTQGERLSEKLKDGIWESKWSHDLRTESLSLVAGKYGVKTRKVNEIKISTYFFPEDDRFSEVFLDAAEEYLKIYSDLLGPYPYKKFDIVQNFFSSGYGFPTFTLLAPEAIRQGKEFLRPGALDHEIVHSWWGHYVSVKPGTGNWVEALTTYCTNYYYKELKMGDEAARKHRQDVMQKYAIQVPSSKDYPLRRFEEKHDEGDGQIGYGKGSMVFHMLRRTVGRELFFATLRNFSEQYGGKQASWDDLKQVFEEGSDQKLDRFFSQWLDRPGGPQLKLENVEWEITSKGYLVSGEVVQEGEVYQLSIPLKIDDGTEKTSSLLEISRRRNPFSFSVANLPSSITLDPRSHVFRRLSQEEIIPGLNALLEDPEKIYVVSDREEGERRKSYIELARMAMEKKGGEILSLKEITGEKVLRSSLMLLGDSWKDPLFSKIISNIPPPVRLKNGVFHLDGEKVDGEDESLLLTYPHPFRPGKWVTIYFGQSAAALSRARYIFFYGWDSYLLFKKGKPEKRGSFSGQSPFISYDLFSKDLLNEISLQRLKDDVSHLASKELAGRLPGTPGYQKAQTYLVQQLEGMGLSPILQPFTLRVKDIEKASLIIRRPEREEKIRALPFYFSKEGEWKGPLAAKDFNGKGALLVNSDLSQEGLLDKIKEVQSQGAQAILVLVKEEDLDRLAPYVTYPSSFPPELEERLRHREREGYVFHRLIEASKTVSKAHRPDFPIHIPILVTPYSQAEGWVKDVAGGKEETIELSLQFKEMHLKDSNLGAIIYGRHPEKKGEFLVLGAHYDHLGKDEKGRFYYSGADDNASGVAALLEIGRSLIKRKMDLRRSVILLFFGGEEWGLKGSEHFIKNPFVPLNQVKAMFSLDGIGGSTDEKEIFFIGGSFYPSLTERSRRFLHGLAMKEGRDIDRFAFSFGSDHYPFHQKGIPSLDYFSSDYKKLHTLRDNLEAIDFDHLADVTGLIYVTAYEFLTEP